MQKQATKRFNLTDVLIIIYFVSIYVFAITTGVTYISKIASIPMFAALLIYTFSHGNKLFFLKYEKAFLVFIGICFLSCFYAANFDYALSKVFTLLQIFVFAIFIHNYLKRENRSYVLLWGFCVGGCALAAYTLYFYGVSEYLQAALSGIRMGSDLANVNTIGNLELFPILILFWCIYYKRKWLAIFPMALCLVVALGTGSRKVIACIAVGILMLYFFKGQGLKKFKNVLSAIALVFVIYMIVQLPGFAVIKSEIDSILNIFTRKNALTNSDIHRFELLNLGFNTFLKSPLFGIGIGNTRNVVLAQMGNDYYLHNNYLEILASVGLLGAIPYFYLWIYPVLINYKKLRIKSDLTPLVMTLMCTALVLQMGQVMYYDKVTYFILLFVFMSIEKNNLRKARGDMRCVGNN